MVATFTAREALAVFFAVTWQIGFVPLGSYRLFETHLLWSPDTPKRLRALRRLGLGIFMVNLVPIGLFIILFYVVIPEGRGGWLIAAAAIASQSVFGIRRLVHSFAIANSHWRWFYGLTEREELIRRLDRAHDALEVRDFWRHCLPGIGYLVFFPALAYGMTFLG